jgi:hypothetical protein
MKKAVFKSATFVEVLGACMSIPYMFCVNCSGVSECAHVHKYVCVCVRVRVFCRCLLNILIA